MSDCPQRPFRIGAANLRPMVAAAMRTATISLPDILAELGLSRDLFADPTGATLELADYFRLSGRLAQSTGDETFPLSRRPLMSGSSDFVLSHIAGSANMLEAMKRVANARNMLHGGTYNHVESDELYIRFVVDDSHFPYALRDEQYLYFAVECVLILFHCTMTLAASPALGTKLLRLHLKRPWRPRPGGHLDFWRVPIRWKSPTYALVYDLSAASLPVPQKAEEVPSMSAVYRRIADLIDTQARERPLPYSFTERVQAALESGQHTQSEVANLLGLSVASLRRRLEEEDTSFRVLRQQVLNDTAKALLDRGEHIGEVAEALDFADLRSFTRAFKQWNGFTPAGYLARRRHSAA